MLIVNAGECCKHLVFIFMFMFILDIDWYQILIDYTNKLTRAAFAAHLCIYSII